MKKFILSAIFLFFSLPSLVLAQEEWVIENFESNIDVSTDGKVSVDETISVDFKNLEKHGIYRDLPYVYDEDGKIRYTEVEVNNVLQDGKEAETQITRNENNLRIRIGDADKTISGKHIYKISYTVLGILKSFEGHDELYWNVTGNGWDVPIIQASSRVNTPVLAITKSECFEGPLFSTNTCSNEVVSGKLATFSSNDQLAPGDGMTIVVGFEKGIFNIVNLERPPSFLERIISGPSMVMFAATLIVGIFVVIALWFKHGRDYWIPGISGFSTKSLQDNEMKPVGAHEPVIVEYTPPEKLTPALVGILMDERADTLDVTSTIIDLASRGYLTITEVPKKWVFGSVDFVFKETNKDKSKLMAYEKELLSGIFTKKEIKMSELKNKFYTTLAKVKEKLYQEAVDRKYFPSNPEKTRNVYLAFGIVGLTLSISGLVASIIGEQLLLFDVSFAGIFISILLVVFSRFMSKRTALGREMYRRTRGYRMFIDRAENYRQQFFERKNIFTEVLPYAIVFGLTAKFAHAMEKMGIEPKSPTWYHGTGVFTASHFTNEVSTFSNSLSTAISSTPSSSGFSSGGGFSGGGGGGGGGGSW